MNASTLWTGTQRPKGLMVSKSLETSELPAPLHPLWVGLNAHFRGRTTCRPETAQAERNTTIKLGNSLLDIDGWK